MSDRSRDNVIRHPADERTADQSTQPASGTSAEPGPGPDVVDDILNRNSEELYKTPRRYDEDEDGNDAA